jgi:hypothetical protein
MDCERSNSAAKRRETTEKHVGNRSRWLRPANRWTCSQGSKESFKQVTSFTARYIDHHHRFITTMRHDREAKATLRPCLRMVDNSRPPSWIGWRLSLPAAPSPGLTIAGLVSQASHGNRPPSSTVNLNVRSSGIGRLIEETRRRSTWIDCNDSDRVGARLDFVSLQTRCTVALETPNSRAIARQVHRARPCGGRVA